MANFTLWCESLGNYRLEFLRSRRTAAFIPATELFTAGLLLVAPLRLGAIVATTLFVSTFVVLVLALLNGASGDCGCYGVVMSATIGPGTAVRSLSLAAWSAGLALVSEPLGFPFTGASASWPILVIAAAGTYCYVRLREAKRTGSA